MNFSQYLSLIEFLEQAGAVSVPFGWAGELSQQVPKMDLGLPLVKRSGKIALVIDKKNPIYVQLVDGTKLFFTNDEYRRIQGKPEAGRTMTVLFQRLDRDRSDIPSRIVKCMVD